MTDEAIDDLPPSAKLVYKVLEYNGGLTQKAIVERSMLSQRTVRDALSRLREIDAVTEEIYVPDARQRRYELQLPDSGGQVASAEPEPSDCG